MTYKLEDYLLNKRPPEEDEPKAKVPEITRHTDTGPLDEHDREWLRRLKNEPGYTILWRMFQNVVLAYEDSAKVLSADPLNNAHMMVNAWTYAATARDIKEHLESEIALELAK